MTRYTAPPAWGRVMPVILDLCAGSGNWSQPYAEAGYDIRRVEIEGGEDVRLFRAPSVRIHGILAAPPCTHLAGSGARWWKGKGEAALLDGLSVVDACLRLVLACQPVWWVLENPVGRLSQYLGKPVTSYQPWEYGDPWTKRTCLWGSFVMPPKSPVEPVEGGRIWRMAPSPERARMRSLTPAGFARAFFEANP